MALKYGKCLIFPEHCCNHRSKRIEDVQFHHIAAGVETEQVCNPAVRTTEQESDPKHHESYRG